MHGTVDESVDSSLVPDGILVLVNYGLIGNTHTGVTTMRAFCTGMYCITKVWQVWPLLARFYRAVRTLCTPQPYGVRASGDLLAKAGNQCAVCFGEFNRPLAVSARHRQTRYKGNCSCRADTCSVKNASAHGWTVNVHVRSVDSASSTMTTIGQTQQQHV
jgi:hypothetical protein